MAEELSFEKYLELGNLKRGDKIRLTNGKIVVFDVLKMKNFHAVMDGKMYQFPIFTFEEVVERAPEKKPNKGYLKLKPGDLFYTVYNNNVCVFAFERMATKNILAVNPVTNGKMRIDPILYGGTIKELVKINNARLDDSTVVE